MKKERKYRIGYCDSCGWKKRLYDCSDEGEFCEDCIEVELGDGSVVSFKEYQRVCGKK